MKKARSAAAQTSFTNVLLAVDIFALCRNVARHPTGSVEKLAPKRVYALLKFHSLSGAFKIPPDRARCRDQIGGRAQCVKSKFQLIVCEVVAKLFDYGNAEYARSKSTSVVFQRLLSSASMGDG